MVVLPLVEGHGEMAAAPELIRKLCFELGRFDIEVRRGYRASRSGLSDPQKLSQLIEAAYAQYRPDAILILFDADDDCPKELRQKLFPVCDSAPVRCSVVVANREYEAWFLGAVLSLRGQAGVRPDAEGSRKP